VKVKRSGGKDIPMLIASSGAGMVVKMREVMSSKGEVPRMLRDSRDSRVEVWGGELKLETEEVVLLEEV
jgi:hypothetical protein